MIVEGQQHMDPKELGQSHRWFEVRQHGRKSLNDRIGDMTDTIHEQ
jgi:hypothetical protein